MWKPWTASEIVELVLDELESLSASERAQFKRLQCLPRLVSWRRMAAFGSGDALDEDSVWVIGQTGSKVLFFDTLEEEFGVGRLNKERLLEDYQAFGERLAWVLHDGQTATPRFRSPGWRQ